MIIRNIILMSPGLNWHSYPYIKSDVNKIVLPYKIECKHLNIAKTSVVQ